MSVDLSNTILTYILMFVLCFDLSLGNFAATSLFDVSKADSATVGL